MRAIYADRLPTMTPMERVKAGLCDPKQIFPKPEPHGLSKIESKRWRAIWGMSMIDLCCQAVTTEPMDKDTIMKYQGDAQDHFCSGMGHHDDGIARIGRAIERLFPDGNVISADVTG